MVKKGRPAKAGQQRYDSGRLKPQQQNGYAPALWRRIAEMAKVASDPIHGSEIGRLQFSRELTHRQAEIAHRIGDTYRRWHRAQRLRTSAKSAQLEEGFGAADRPPYGNARTLAEGR